MSSAAARSPAGMSARLSHACWGVGGMADDIRLQDPLALYLRLGGAYAGFLGAVRPLWMIHTAVVYLNNDVLGAIIAKSA